MPDAKLGAAAQPVVGEVSELWMYPVKSLQGVRTDRLVVTVSGVSGDRRWGMVDEESGKVLSAKREPRLLEATVNSEGSVITLDDGTVLATDDPAIHDALSAWLGRPVNLQASAKSAGLSYQMTFDPPDDTAEIFDIPVPPGTFVDLAPLHLVTGATLARCAALRPDLDFDVRRFRPNLVLDVDVEPFAEDNWTGQTITMSEVILRITQPTVRCAMPLRAQPAHSTGGPALARQPDLHAALNELNPVFPNHLGVYAEVVTAGVVNVGDHVVVPDGA